MLHIYPIFSKFYGHETEDFLPLFTATNLIQATIPTALC